MLSDEELVDRSRNGDLDSFNQLVLRWERPIYALAYRTIGREEEARDVAQETFLRAFRALGGFKGQAKFSSWLYRITLNLCRDWIRKERRTPVSPAPEGVDLIELAGEANPVDEVHVVYTRFRSMLIQEPTATRLLPLEVVEGEEPPAAEEVLPLYEFEPNAAEVLDSLLPRYVQSRIFFALLQAAASELAARQRAMKAATDNAEELIKKYTRLANQARQAGITQEISEIVGGVNALADAQAEAR